MAGQCFWAPYRAKPLERSPPISSFRASGASYFVIPSERSEPRDPPRRWPLIRPQSYATCRGSFDSVRFAHSAQDDVMGKRISPHATPSERSLLFRHPERADPPISSSRASGASRGIPHRRVDADEAHNDEGAPKSALVDVAVWRTESNAANRRIPTSRPL